MHSQRTLEKIGREYSQVSCNPGIIADMEGIRPSRQKTASEMRAVLDRLSDFARRITEIGNRSELHSPTVIRIVSSKLEPELYYECERWMRYHHPTEELSVNRIVQFLRTETEARERLTQVRSARVEKPTYSMNHVSALTFTDPCILGCGVHHKFIDCLAFRSKQPWQRCGVISRAGRCFSCFCRHRANDCPNPKHCSDCGDQNNMLNCETIERRSAPETMAREISNKSVSPMN